MRRRPTPLAAAGAVLAAGTMLLYWQAFTPTVFGRALLDFYGLAGVFAPAIGWASRADSAQGASARAALMVLGVTAVTLFLSWLPEPFTGSAAGETVSLEIFVPLLAAFFGTVIVAPHARNAWLSPPGPARSRAFVIALLPVVVCGIGSPREDVLAAVLWVESLLWLGMFLLVRPAVPDGRRAEVLRSETV